MKLVYQCHTETVGTLLFQSWPIAHVSFSPQYIHLHYSDMSLWRGLNWDADLSNTHESVSSPGPPMTKAFLQSFMPGSSLETHVSQEILWDLLQIEFWWPSLSLPKITDIYKSYNSSRYKWDSSWGPFWTRLAVSIIHNKLSLNCHWIKSTRWKKFKILSMLLKSKMIMIESRSAVAWELGRGRGLMAKGYKETSYGAGAAPYHLFI